MNNVRADLTEFDQPSRALNVLSFACPPLGIVIYSARHHIKPHQAISAAHCAIAGVAFCALGFALLCLSQSSGMRENFFWMFVAAVDFAASLVFIKRRLRQFRI